MNEIKCPKCGTKIDIDDILTHDIEEKVREQEANKHKAELEKIKQQAAEFANQQLNDKLKLERSKQAQELELLDAKYKTELEMSAKKQTQEQELLVQKLTKDAELAKEDNAKMRKSLGELMDELRSEKKAREDAELAAKKQIAEEEEKIRKEEKQRADEEHRLKILEMEKKLTDTQKSLADAQRKAEQGSQQNQGEVLELDLEESIRFEFPTDEITEVKKGARGADITQVVKNNRLERCGVILWESKNAAWQAGWIAKFKDDIRKADANVGILVSKELPEVYGEMKNIEGVWVVKPALALALAAAIRAQIMGIFVANQNNENKDAKMEMLYQFLTGTEFRHRIEAIVENYTALQGELEKERRSAEQRWARQEKMIRGVIDNTYGMYGDLQGITGGAIAEIEELDEVLSLSEGKKDDGQASLDLDGNGKK